MPRFDKPGRIVRVDFQRNIALVSVGLGQWEVPPDDVYPADSTSAVGIAAAALYNGS